MYGEYVLTLYQLAYTCLAVTFPSGLNALQLILGFLSVYLYVDYLNM